MSDETTPTSAGVTAETSAPEAVNPETATTEAPAPEQASVEATAEPSPEAEAQSEPVVEKKRSASDRIRQLVSDKKAAEQRAQALEARISALEGVKPPAAEQYDDNAKYTADLAVHAARSAQTEALKYDLETAKTAAAEAQKQAWQERVETVKATLPDVEEVIGNPKLPITEAMKNVALSHEQGVDLAYFWGKNPAVAARTAAITDPVALGVEIGRALASLQAAAAPPKKISTAPAPAPMVSGGASGGKTVDLETTSYREYRIARGFPPD